jgi:hypothetical protein
MSNNLRQLRQCWLSPTGEIRGLFLNHESEAFEILKELGKYKYFFRQKLDRKNRFHYAYEYLETLGWIRLHAAKQKWILMKRPTFLQRKVIKDWCMYNNVTYDKSVEIQYDGYQAL